MPVEIFIADVPAVKTYQLPAALALAGEVGLVAGDAGGSEVSEDVLLSSQLGVTVPAAEVVGVPVPAHGPGVRPGKDQLVAGPAARLHLLRVVPGLGFSRVKRGLRGLPFTVDLVLIYTVGEVH